MPGSTCTQIDYERAARALVQAALEGDAKASATEGITIRSIRRYRQRLEGDELLSRLVREKLYLAEREWAHKLAPAIRSALDFIARAGQQANPRDPNAIHAMAGALKLVTEAEVTKKVIDARLAASDRDGREAPHRMASEGVQAN